MYFISGNLDFIKIKNYGNVDTHTGEKIPVNNHRVRNITLVKGTYEWGYRIAGNQLCRQIEQYSRVGIASSAEKQSFVPFPHMLDVYAYGSDSNMKPEIGRRFIIVFL